jgi:hypothetical protein
MWKEVFFALFKVQSRHLHEGLNETSRDSRSTGLNQGPSDNETGRLDSRTEYLVQNTRRLFPEDKSTQQLSYQLLTYLLHGAGSFLRS